MYGYINYLSTLVTFHSSFKVVIVNDHYPIHPEDQETVRKFSSQFHDFIWIDAGKNLGMQGAINFALKEVNAQPEDIVILSDPDDYASAGSYQALESVIRHKDFAVVALGFKQIDDNRKKLNPIPRDDFAFLEPNIKYWIHPSVDLWHIAAYRMEWIQSIGGFGQAYKYWGGLESYMYERMVKDRMKLVYLSDYNCEAVELDRNDPTLFDPEFRQYKNDIHKNQYPGSFSEWLSTNKITFQK